ncbi:54S ribosomal protein L40, mitochondrial [Cytospora mali]|uniref:54S ribosomal protein L40, mitochondrial n=1 Tax=Cytospora mali TaxID=578113 RepID=A0A194V1A3_CYTMA|nr:54S ribosomal protein L40, mitochondrial [Valsa mali var. pyri (nom. inval.)]
MAQRAKQREDFKRRMSATQHSHRALKEAARRRREDWEMGPLAPQRDTPLKDSTDAYYGTIGLRRNMGEDFPEKQRELACRWAGGRKTFCVKPGDRVAIMEGPDKGKIGIVKFISEEQGNVSLEGEHLQHNFTVPDYMSKLQAEGGAVYAQLAEYRVPLQAIRLVHPLKDPATGKVRDVIINELAVKDYYKDKATGRETWARVVPGLNIEIPWPKAFEDAERQELEDPIDDNPGDTLRLDAEETTFVPTLLRPPMPSEVLDELRNRYSKFRTRHEPAYIAKKEAEEAEKVARRKALKTMQTPLQELNARIKEERKARGQPELTDEMLARIGEVMARNRKRTLAGAAAAQAEARSKLPWIPASGTGTPPPS